MKFTDWFTQHDDADIRARVRSSTRLAMTDGERERGREFLIRYMAMHPAREASRVSRYAFLFHPMPIIASLLIIVVSGVSVAGAAEAALPGDTLYTIKVNVNEEVKLALATSPAKKADVSLARAEARLAELELLALREEIDETLRDEIDERVDEHVHEAEEIISELDEPRETARRVVAILRAHEVLVSPAAIGGYAEPEVSVAAFAVADAAAPADAQSDAPVTMMMAAPADETARTSATADAPVQEAAFIANDDASAKRSAPAPAPAISEKALKRQERAARERIEALEKFATREEKQNGKRANPTDTSVLTAGLANARDAFENARAAIETGNALDASAFFNSAVRFAIDAREQYTEMQRIDETRNTNDESRGRGSDDARNETGDDRSDRSRDSDDD